MSYDRPRTRPPQTRPPATWLTDEFREADEALGRDEEEMNQHEYGFGKFFQWMMGVIGTSGVLLLGWLCFGVSSLKTDVAVLNARPAPVSQDEFRYAMQDQNRQLTDQNRRLTAIEAKVK